MIADALIRILIVEDEYILAIILKENLESLGYEVLDIIDSGEIAMATAARLRPNLVLMDIRLRGETDGIQAAEQIWQELQIPVIYVTGYSDRSTVARATLTSPFGYILKPVREKELYVAIQTALHQYEREQFLNAVLQSMGDGVIVVDMDLRIQYLNQMAEFLTGWPLAEVRGRSVTEVICFMDESSQEIIEHPAYSAIQQNSTIYLNGHTLLVTRDGNTIPVADSATPLKNHQGELTGSVIVFRDDTQRRLLEERNFATERAQLLETQMSELQRLDALKDDFLATTSHELRTPLANIKMAISVLQERLTRSASSAIEQGTNAQAIDRYFTILRDQCDQELRLVNDLLDMRSMQADAYHLDPTPLQLQDWLPSITESFRERSALQQQEFQLEIAPDFPAIVADPSSLNRIISELLNNACKYTPPNGTIQVIAQPAALGVTAPALTATSGISVTPPMPAFQLIVRNSGVDLAREELLKIFDPFYRIPSKNPWKQRGTGLGLALIKKLVAYLQGTIAVTSDQGWINFIVQLPIDIS